MTRADYVIGNLGTIDIVDLRRNDESTGEVGEQ